MNFLDTHKWHIVLAIGAVLAWRWLRGRGLIGGGGGAGAAGATDPIFRSASGPTSTRTASGAAGLLANINPLTSGQRATPTTTGPMVRGPSLPLSPVPSSLPPASGAAGAQQAAAAAAAAAASRVRIGG